MFPNEENYEKKDALDSNGLYIHAPDLRLRSRYPNYYTLSIAPPLKADVARPIGRSRLRCSGSKRPRICDREGLSIAKLPARSDFMNTIAGQSIPAWPSPQQWSRSLRSARLFSVVAPYDGHDRSTIS